MTTSRNKAAGSAAERRVAALVKGRRIGMDGGPVDVIVDDYLTLQVKTLKSLPGLREISQMIDRMPVGFVLRAVVVIGREGSGRRGVRTITFDLDEWAAWHA